MDRLCLAVILILPGNMLKLPLLTAIVLITAWFNGMCYGIQFAIPAEGKVPARLSASAICFGSAIGYIPDVFQHTMFGSWMDSIGNAAYDYIFLYGIGVAVIATVALTLFARAKRKNKLTV